MSAYLQRTGTRQPGRHRAAGKSGRTLAFLSPLPWLATGQLPGLIAFAALVLIAVGVAVWAVT